MAAPRPPIAKRTMHSRVVHGVTLEDPYHWLKDPGYPEVTEEAVLEYLRSENEYFEQAMAPYANLVGALFEEIIQHTGRSYALRAIASADYERHMRPRSERWGTVSLPAATFDRLSGPLLGPTGSPALAPQTARIPALAGTGS